MTVKQKEVQTRNTKDTKAFNNVLKLILSGGVFFISLILSLTFSLIALAGNESNFYVNCVFCISMIILVSITSFLAYRFYKNNKEESEE